MPFRTRSTLILTALVCSAGLASAQDAKIAVQDQRVESGNIVKVQEVTSPADGFLVIHAANDANSSDPGKAIGYAVVNSGSNSNVSVKLEEDVKSGERLHAVLHEDTTKTGMFDAARDEPAAKPDGTRVMASFTAR